MDENASPLDEVRVSVPYRLDLRGTLAFLRQLEELPPSAKYIFDFAHLAYVSPFGFLVASDAIRRFRLARMDTKFAADNHQGKTYHAHMGFFRAFGLKFGNKPGEADGNSNYLPITIRTVEEFDDDASMKGVPLGEAIEERAKSLAQVLARSDDGDLVDVLTYSLREIIRNVSEHSKSPTVSYCAQYWPSKDCVEIAILDSGIGVKSSLADNPYLEIRDDHEALNVALLPGVSGKTFKGVRRRRDDVWQNSGFGLYMTSRLCRRGGEFFIASKRCGLQLKDSEKNYFETDIPGTVIQMTLRPSLIGKVSKLLLTFSSEGNEIAREIGAGSLSASRASQMLSSDFRKERS